MLLDVRTYTCRPGTIKKHIALYEKMGKTPQTRHLGQPLAHMAARRFSRSAAFSYTHMWMYWLTLPVSVVM